MNTCVYYYKGKLIGNIIQLDTFLLEKQRYETEFGDIVFEIETNSRVLHSKELLNKASAHQEELQETYFKAKKQYKDGETFIDPDPPYVGVSGFLSGQRDAEGKLYFPEFIEGNYWSNRFKAWSEGSYTPDEINLFFEGDQKKVQPLDLGNMNDWKDSNGNFKEDFGSDEQKRLRKLMKEKWEFQAKYGTEVHNVLQQYFSRDLQGNLRGDLWNRNSYELQKSITYLRNKGDITDVMTQEKIGQIIEYANNLKKVLEKNYGKNLNYYPEFVMTAKLNKEYKNDKGQVVEEILGRLDLLVLDSEGYPHIIDYKTSPKPYEEYSEAKKLGFTYQLGTYQRMLRRWGLNTLKTDVMVAPIQLENFRKEGEDWKYDKVSVGALSRDPLIPLNDRLNKPYLNNNLDDFIEAPLIIEGDSEDIINKVTKTFSKWFPRQGNTRTKTDEQVRQLINEQNGFTVNPKTGNYEFSPKGSSKVLITSPKERGEEAFFKKVKKYYSDNKEGAIEDAKSIIKALKEGQENNTDQLILSKHTDDWIKLKLSKYCNDNWEVLSGGPASDAALQFGMILLHNINTDVIDVVKISGSHVKYQNTWGADRNNITGGIEIDGKAITDSEENSKSDSLILKAVDGNLELMESMLVLNNLKFNKNITVGRIQVISCFSEPEGLTASNKELKYNWEKLNSLIPIEEEDKFKTNQVKLLSKAENCYMEFKEVFSRTSSSKRAAAFNLFKTPINQFYNAIKFNNTEEALNQLNQIRVKLERDFGMKKDIDSEKRSIHSKLESYEQQFARTLYQQVSQAILELNNFDIRQALQDHSSYVESWKIWKKGLSGNYQDNAGNFGNAMLNQVTALALEGYQNSRDKAYPRIQKLRSMVEDLKKELGYNKIIEHTIGNQTSLYKDMTYYAPNGDLLFVNPWDNTTLSNKQKDFLKHVILEINKDRLGDLKQQEIDEYINNNDPSFFQVPLLEASTASKIETGGWNNWIKDKCKIISSKAQFKKYLKDQASEFLDDEEENFLKSRKDKEIFDVINLMDQGNGVRRLEIIQKQRKDHGDAFYERDLETILSQHIWAYSVQEAMENRMPLIKAAYISLAVMGNDQNYSFENDEKFLREFVDNRINHKSITEFKTVKGALGTIQKAASWMALAFSPVQFSYQMLEAIWKDAKLIITKPDGSEAFTFPNMKNAAKVVYAEFGHYSDDPSVCSAVNSLYGINDMDNAAFAENNTSNNHGIFNFFGKFAYKFSSRPDFYSRMTIFVSQMMQDGSWEAHKINKKTNQLEYNWKLDQRFKAYATDDKHDIEAYNKSRALYYATAQQLVREGARNPDGSLFVISEKAALPKAYSNKESEAKKAVADTMYGYYDSTKKSLMQSTLLGGLLMQMRTYWSAKKNQYLAPGGIKAQGRWEQAKDPGGNLLFYSKNEKGEIDINSKIVTKEDKNCSDIPFMQWKGKFEEGVIITLCNILRECKNQHSLKDGWNAIMNNPDIDPDVLKTYRSNLKLIVTDLVMWGLIGGAALCLGGWSDDIIKDAKKSGNMDDALAATWSGLVYKTVYNSSLDFAWWKAIFDISMDWNPFALSYIGKEVGTMWDLLIGDTDFTKAITTSFSAARQLRPVLLCVGDEE